jgi:UDP-N-acetylmuramoyl-L-alanyl-D-glutamate--2,6-diaminopimelate ligase
MNLADLCKGIVAVPESANRIEVKDLAYDSRQVNQGCLFIAIPGFQRDGRQFIDEAIRRGASAVASEGEIGEKSVPVLQTENARKTMALLAKRFFGDPSDQMLVAGITGTNGKTTVCYLLESILKHAGFKTGLLGTVSYRWNSHEESASRTTPESIDVQHMMRKMADAGVCAVAMEMSSHALALDRVAGIQLQAALFTNLTRDHLDFHGNLESYGKAKTLLFGMLRSDGVAVVNADDPASKTMLAAAVGRRATVGLLSRDADYRIQDVRLEEGRTQFSLMHQKETIPFSTTLWGKFNVYNAALASVAGLELRLDSMSVREGVRRMEKVPGRMEGFLSKRGIRVVVDYAHTPDALENVISAVREFTKGRVLTVFGCGGDRDRGKRPKMGRIASKLSDRVVVTSDNPRSENPEAIIAEVLAGIRNSQNVMSVVDRQEAVRAALERAESGDTVLLAGKGHEDYQEIGGVRHPFNDRKIAEAFLKERGEL